MKLHTAKMLGQRASLLALTLVLAACGTSTNPAEDYKDLPQVPVHEQTNEPQELLPGDVFLVRIPDGMNFVEGQEAAYLVKVKSRLSSLKFRLAASGLPAGLTMTPVNDANPQGDYLIKGTVAIGSSPVLNTGLKQPIKISAIDVSGDPSDLRVFSTLLKSWEPTIRVFATDRAPIVEPRDISGLSVAEGQKITISLVVKDEGSTGTQVPKIQAPFRNSSDTTEVEIISAMPGLSVKSTPEALGEHRFKFTAVLDTSKLTLPAGKKDVKAQFVVNFRSPSNLVSAEEVVDVKIVRAAPVVVAPQTPVAAAPAPQAAPQKPAAPQAAPVVAPAAPVVAPATAAPATAAPVVAPEATTATPAVAAPAAAKPAAKSTAKAATKPAAKAATKPKVTAPTPKKTVKPTPKKTPVKPVKKGSN